MRRSAIIAPPLTQSDRAKISRWLRRVKERVRARHHLNHPNHLVRGDDDLAAAIVDYSSIAEYGWTWPGDDRLAQILNECDRNIRKRVKRLRSAQVLMVIPVSEGWHTKRYIPVLDGRPLFDVALTSLRVRDAIAALTRDGTNTETPVQPESSAESGTPVPAQEERAFQEARNERSTESSRNNLRESNSPSPCPTSTAASGSPQGEEEIVDLDLQEACSAAPPAPTPNGTTKSTEQPTPPDGCPRDDEPGVRAKPDRAEQAAAPVVEFSFARLLRDYPHPAGEHSIEQQAYRGHARNAWGKLTAAQKQDAVRAAPNAPGKEWLGHWLNNGHETGKFEIIEQCAVVARVWVQEDTPQWAAWVKDYGAKGRRPRTTQHRVDGELQTGWMFESEWPPNLENPEGVVGAQ